MNHTRQGLALGIVAYVIWGVLPLYFRALGGVPAVDIVAHRILWSMLFLGALITLMRAWPSARTALATRRTMTMLVASAVLIAVNWLAYIHAVSTGRVLAGSLGYYLSPLFSVLLGVIILKEPLSRYQRAALLLAFVGVALLAVEAGSGLWISLTLAVSFSLYGLVRKLAPVDAVTGLAIETAILAPVSALWLLLAGAPAYGQSTGLDLLLILSGIATAGPLLLFTAAARRLRYATLGILQFIAPTMQFALAVFLFDEPFGRDQLIAFTAIWSALALYAWDGLRIWRRDEAVAAAALTAHN